MADGHFLAELARKALQHWHQALVLAAIEHKLDLICIEMLKRSAVCHWKACLESVKSKRTAVLKVTGWPD